MKKISSQLSVQSKESLDSSWTSDSPGQTPRRSQSILNSSTIFNINQSRPNKKNKKKKIVYTLRRTILRIFMIFSILVMIMATIYTVYGILWRKLFVWSREGFENAVLLNIDILAQTGAINTQDALVMDLNDLKISQAFVQSIIDEGFSSSISQSNYYQKYQAKTKDSFDIAFANHNEGLYSSPDPDLQVFYTYPLVSQYNMFAQQYVRTEEPRERTEEQMYDFDVCRNSYYVMQNILKMPQAGIDRPGSYIGFESESFCYNPAIAKSYFFNTMKKDSWKCDRSDTGYYNPVCRGWYKLQQEHPDSIVMSDLYPFAEGKTLLGMTFCVPLNKTSANTGQSEFYAALCSDLKLNLSSNLMKYVDGGDPDPDWFLEHNGAELYLKDPAIMQKQNSIELAEQIVKVTLNNELDAGNFDWKEVFAQYFRDADLTFGDFQVGEPQYDDEHLKWKYLTNDYKFLDGQYSNQGELQKVFFVYKQIQSYGYRKIVPNQYQYFMFRIYAKIHGWQKQEELIAEHVRDFWIPYFCFANLCYLLICWVVIRLIGKSFSEPIITLGIRVKQNVKNIHKMRQIKEAEEKGQKKAATDAIANLQIDLLKGYKQQNKETNDLYFSFNAMARVIFMGYQSTYSTSSYQALQNMHDACEVFQNQKNDRAAGILYMNLGCMIAAQSKMNYYKADLYFLKAENLQRKLIDKVSGNQQSTDIQESLANSQSKIGAVNEDNASLWKIGEDQYILAFRLYTRGIIAYNHFISEIESSQISDDNEKEDNQMKLTSECIYFATHAIINLQRCLEEMPEFGKLREKKQKKQEENAYDVFCSDQSKTSSSGWQDSVSKFNKDNSVSLLDMDAILLEDQEPAEEEIQESLQPIKKKSVHLGIQDLDASAGYNQSQSVTIKDEPSSTINTPNSDSSSQIPFSKGLNQVNLGIIREQITTHRTFGMDDTEFQNARETEAYRQFREHQTSDGFYDFKVFIRLVILEIKIQLFPSLPKTMLNKQQTGVADSDFHSSYTSDSGFPTPTPDKSRQVAKKPKTSEQMQVKVLDSDYLENESSIEVENSLKTPERSINYFGSDSEDVFQEESQDIAGINLVRFFVQDIDYQYQRDNTILISNLNEEIADLHVIVMELDIDKLPRIKRFGFDYFLKDHLWQFQTYLEGLANLIIEPTPSTQRRAIKKFVKSLQLTSNMLNSTTRKTLLAMHEVLKQDETKKIAEINYFNLTSAKESKISLKKEESIIRRNSTSLEAELFFSQIGGASSDINFERQKISLMKKITLTPLAQNLESEYNMIKRKIEWVSAQLSHHVQEKRCIQFVLDCEFDHFLQKEKCQAFICNIFDELGDDDYFGLSNLDSHAIHQIPLEETRKNRIIKRKLLSNLKEDKEYGSEQMNTRRQKFSHVLDDAVYTSKKVPVEKFQYHGINFIDKQKWVVAFIGSQKDFLHLEGITIHPSVNMLIVCMMNENSDQADINLVKELISKTNEGGFMIVRYKMDDMGGTEEMDKALEQVRTAIKLYPSKVVPIIQEELDF